MREQALTEWLNSQETQALIHYLRRRRAPIVNQFLAGMQITQMSQGRAQALYELETLFARPAEEIHAVLKEDFK
jgi:hypothetical protein